jgi:hypothetical protein
MIASLPLSPAREGYRMTLEGASRGRAGEQQCDALRRLLPRAAGHTAKRHRSTRAGQRPERLVAADQVKGFAGSGRLSTASPSDVAIGRRPPGWRLKGCTAEKISRHSRVSPTGVLHPEGCDVLVKVLPDGVIVPSPQY